MTYNEFVTHIQEYLSDTFHKPGMSRKRAGKLAQRCLQYFVDNRLDGCLLSDFYELTKGEIK